MGRQGSSLWLCGCGLIALFLATPSAASVRLPEMDGTNALRASAAIALDSATNGTSAPSDGLGAVPTSTPTAAPVISPNSICPSNGLPGVESVNGKTCCMAYCIECAGVGCSSRGNASHCCATEIAQHAEDCNISGESPCFITPPEPWVPEHTLTYFLYFFVIPFIVIAVLCNRKLLPGCREKGDPDDPANTAHLHGHNTGAAPAALSKKSPSPPAQAKETSGQANRASGRAVEASGRAEGASSQGAEASGGSAL